MYPRYIDTDKMYDVGNEIVNLATEYELEITRLFKRLNNVPYITKEWVGNQAEKYISIVALDKNEYMDFGEAIKEYGKSLKKCSQMLNEEIINMKNKEYK